MNTAPRRPAPEQGEGGDDGTRYDTPGLHNKISA